MDSFSRRKATADDADALANIKYQCWHDTYRGIISDGYLDAMRIDDLKTSWQKILSPQNKRTITDLMVNDAKEIIGYI